jgi:surface polysaccharide O-acyltransferase-like enzyme
MKISTKALSLSENRTKHYNCIDLIKFICALFVVSIHVSPFASYNSFINYGLKNYIARIAVPFFFVASGYFRIIELEVIQVIILVFYFI